MPFRILECPGSTNPVYINPREVVSFENVHDSKVLRVNLTNGNVIDLQGVDAADFATDIEDSLCCECGESADDAPTADVVPEGKP
ncbi:MAG: hypothetical protein ACKVW3_11720 [Phycisphaerales bacterium]